MGKKPTKFLVLITLLALIILTLVAYFIFRPQVELTPPVTIDTRDQPTLGNPRAPIHIVAFEDLKCENCMRFTTRLLPQIKQKYINTGKATFTFINVAFIEGSLPAANAARCLYAENKDYFFPFVDYLLDHQPPENENWATVSTLIQYAKASVPHANLTELSNCIIEARYNYLINKNLTMAVKIMDKEIATPAVYINGHKLKKLTMDAIDKMIDNLSKSK